tara:strand:- start:1180 stop:1437 length:258 start_codon:yes stop_codon:yes gene_type:complete
MKFKPETTVYVSIKEYNFNKRELKGLVEASEFQWNFTWSFTNGKLFVNPPLGRALIEDSLLRFLIKKDYELESGSNYKFTVSSKF